MQVEVEAAAVKKRNTESSSRTGRWKKYVHEIFCKMTGEIHNIHACSKHKSACAGTYKCTHAQAHTHALMHKHTRAVEHKVCI